MSVLSLYCYCCISSIRADLQVPFRLSCGTPGRLRWVTTNIARFDPSVEWPADLDCSFDWNRGLKSYDGACATLGGAKVGSMGFVEMSKQVSTQPQHMSVGSSHVSSSFTGSGI